MVTGKWTMKNASASSTTASGPISAFTTEQIDMLDTSSTYDLALPSGPTSTGEGFSVTWKDSY